MSHDRALMDRLYRSLLQQWAEHDPHFGMEGVMVAVLDLLAAEGRLVEPMPAGVYGLDSEKYGREIWADSGVPDVEHDIPVGDYSVEGGLDLRPGAFADWIWSVVPKREANE